MLKKTILVTGSTDGIGLLTAEMLLEKGHHVLLHGRSADKLKNAKQTLLDAGGSGRIESFLADLSDLDDVDRLASEVSAKHSQLDILINNAGVLKTSTPVTAEGLDCRFVVNTLAPYRLTYKLLPLIPSSGRIINLASAAQAPVDIDALSGKHHLDDMGAYAQSKLGIILWSREFAKKTNAPICISVNPGSLLGTKMVKEGFNTAGGDVGIGADILCRIALDDEHRSANGKYFDNDAERYAEPAIDAATSANLNEILATIESLAMR